MADPNASLYKYKLAVTACYDGDTITGDLFLGFNVVWHDQKIRLWGINTPEVRGKERPEGLIARDFLRDMILDKKIIVRTELDKSGKYGRVLGILYAPVGKRWVCVNKTLVDKGYAEISLYGDKWSGKWPKL